LETGRRVCGVCARLQRLAPLTTRGPRPTSYSKYLDVTVRAQPTHSAMSHFPKKGVESQVAPTLRCCGLYVGHSAAVLADTP
jgi:hypothetical protein